MLPSHPEFGGEEGSRFYAYILRFRTTLCTSQSAVRELRRSSCHRNGLRGTRVSPYPATSSNARLESVTPFELAKPGRPPAIPPTQTEACKSLPLVRRRRAHGGATFTARQLG